MLFRSEEAILFGDDADNDSDDRRSRFEPLSSLVAPIKAQKKAPSELPNVLLRDQSLPTFSRLARFAANKYVVRARGTCPLRLVWEEAESYYLYVVQCLDAPFGRGTRGPRHVILLDKLEWLSFFLSFFLSSFPLAISAGFVAMASGQDDCGLWFT